MYYGKVKHLEQRMESRYEALWEDISENEDTQQEQEEEDLNDDELIQAFLENDLEYSGDQVDGIGTVVIGAARTILGDLREALKPVLVYVLRRSSSPKNLQRMERSLTALISTLTQCLPLLIQSQTTK